MSVCGRRATTGLSGSRRNLEGIMSDTDFMALAVQGNPTLHIKDRFNHANYKLKYKQGRPLLSCAVVPQHLHVLADLLAAN